MVLPMPIFVCSGDVWKVLVEGIEVDTCSISTSTELGCDM